MTENKGAGVTETKRTFFDGRALIKSAGHWWLLDPRQLIDNSILHGVWEPATTAVVKKYLKPGQIVIDVGANVGWYTVIMSELVGPTGQVIAFEAMPEPARLVKAHIALNDIQNAELHVLALGDEDKPAADLFFNYSWSHQGEPVDQHGAPTEVRCLDRVPIPRPVSFIKVDVDGYEAKFLRGAERVLRQDRPVILLEVCDYTLCAADGKPVARPNTHPEYGLRTRTMLEYLASLGYAFLWEEDLQPASIDEMLGRYDLSIRSINVVCIPT